MTKFTTQYCYRCFKAQEFQILAGNETVVARESSHVVAWGSSHVVAWGSSHVVASKYNSVTILGKKVKASGGVQIKIPDVFTPKEWCDFYGVKVKKGLALLFKAVDDDYSTSNARVRSIFYTRGTKPAAPDWDGGKAECGGGLHFSPTPRHARQFNSSATHYVACPVKLSGIKVHRKAQYPGKVKAKRVSAPIYEVDIDGNRIEE